MRSISSALILLLTALPTIGMAQQEGDTEQAEAQHPAQAMMQHRQERMEAMGQMRARMGHMQGRMGQMHGHMDPMRRMAAFAPPHLLERRDVLGLTEEQVSDLKALAENLKGAHEKAETDAKAHREQLMEVWKTDKPDVGQLRAHAKAAMAAEQAEHLAMLTAVAQAKALLTPEQRGRVEGWGDAAEMMRGRMMKGGMMQGGMMQGGMMRGGMMHGRGMGEHRMHDSKPMHPQPEGSR